jgi:hypothetical protein
MAGSVQDRGLWDHLLETAKQVHQSIPAVQAFCPFPTDLIEQDVQAFHIPAANYLAQEKGLVTRQFAPLRDAFIAVKEQALWRETYKETNIGQDFMDRFGCYCLIGQGGPFRSAKMCAWMVYMPPQLHYPWHHHPAEEMYLTVAGEAEFMRAGLPNKVLRAAETSEHTSNQPHAMQTHAHPVMAYVIWRNGFQTPPVLTEGVVR